MNEKNNDDNNNLELLNTTNAFQPSQSLLFLVRSYYLRQLAGNKAIQRRRNEDIDIVSSVVIFLITLFMIYMGIRFYNEGGFDTTSGPRLFFMILSVFLRVILLHRHEVEAVKNIKSKKK